MAEIWTTQTCNLVDSTWYAQQYPVLSLLGLSASEHYVRYGIRLGYRPSPNCDATAELAPENDQIQLISIDEVIDVSDSARLTQKTDYHGNVTNFANLLSRFDTRRILQSITDRIIKVLEVYGSVHHLLCLNFAAGGGAERCTFEYARFSSSKGKAVLILLTDNGPRVDIPALPDNVVLIDFEDIGPQLSQAEREALIYSILYSTQPEIFQIVNSEMAWYMLEKIKRDAIPAKLVLATIFALQFDQRDGSPVGYAARFMPTCWDKFDRCVTDNMMFANHSCSELNLRRTIEFAVVPNPCRLRDSIGICDARAKLAMRIGALVEGKQLGVLWAGRIDAEKRIDVLLEAAAILGAEATFEVFGASVVGDNKSGDALANADNIHLRGRFASPLEWDVDEILPQVFMFTSVWEGMPNALIEASWLGYPIVAAAVGGVSDLINDNTGWLLPRDATAADYVEALREIKTNPAEAQRRTQNLIELVFLRHSEDAFHSSLTNAYNV